MKYKNKMNLQPENFSASKTFQVPDTISSKASEDNKRWKKMNESPPRQTPSPSVPQKDHDKENSVPKSRSNSYVGNKKPPKPKVSSFNPRYLQATESSSRYVHQNREHLFKNKKQIYKMDNALPNYFLKHTYNYRHLISRTK